MAGLTAFNYLPGNTFLHVLDVRVKLAALVMLSLTCIRADLTESLMMTLCLLFLFRAIHLSFRSISRELRYFIVLLLIVFLARAFFTPGRPLIGIWSLTMTHQGVSDGILIAWRLFLIIMLSLLFVSSTRPSDIKVAVERLLAIFPFISRKKVAVKVAVMMSLILRFIPEIVNQAKETLDAQKARGIENRKNPVYRLIKFAVPLIRRTFENADRLALAMEARCYSENRTDPELVSTQKDLLVFAGVTCFCLIIIIA